MKMKNIFKKVTCFMLGIMLLVSPTVAYASEPQFGTSTVTCTVDDNFYVQIPETITVGETATIYAMETNITDDKLIYVRIDGLDGSGEITLTNDTDPSETIKAYFTNESGTKYSSSDNLIGTFARSQTGGINFNACCADVDTHSKKAGSYSGQVYFSITCE